MHTYQLNWYAYDRRGFIETQEMIMLTIIIVITIILIIIKTLIIIIVIIITLGKKRY